MTDTAAKIAAIVNHCAGPQTDTMMAVVHPD